MKGAITPTIDTLRDPLALFPHGVAWSNLSEAWSSVNVGRYFWNTVVLAFGSWLCQIVVATTGAFALSVLRPAWARFIYALLLATLFVPVVVLIVPLYIEIVNPPLINHSFAESYWAIWLPAGASAFNVVIMKRFFDNLPRELFEAARIDGAGALRVFWSIVLPLSKPILGVVSIFAILSEWKNFLWPFLVSDEQPGAAAALGASTRDSGADAARSSAGVDADRCARADPGVPDLPADFSARVRASSGALKG